MGHQTNYEPASLADPRTVASYQSYEAAKAAVAILTERGVSPRQLEIVGLDLRATAKDNMTWSKVILTGVLSGLMWGLLLSVLLWIFLPGQKLWLIILYGLGFGMIYGVLAQVVQYLVTHTSRFGPPNQAVATRFEVKADASVTDEAMRLLTPAEPYVGEPEEPQAQTPYEQSAAFAFEPSTEIAVDPASAEHPRRIAVDDVTWLEEGKTPPVDPNALPYLSDLPTEVMQQPLLLPDPDKSAWFNRPAFDDDEADETSVMLKETTASLRRIRHEDEELVMPAGS